ncbi:hypothetical protein [Algoriphagus confluentis]|uniref:Lipoprotein n=1 Tax=Algoriphagus confluentis TaxID=1697556 RepID=A0ABQ6PN59_9BACT|nr:hypothetical protein Aconfl_17290 [Algoriphagus confluentis]
MRSLYISILFILVSCQKSQNQSLGFEELPSFKEILSSDSIQFLEYFDSTSRIYSNYYHGFSVRVPKGWDSDRGFAKRTVFRLTNYDSGIVFSVTINKFPEQEDIPKSIWGPLVSDSLGYVRDFKRGIRDQVNSDILGLELIPIYYNNLQALKTRYHYLFRSDELEYLMFSEVIQFFRDGNIYTIGLIIPKEFIDRDNRYFSLKNNFNLIPIYYE